MNRNIQPPQPGPGVSLLVKDFLKGATDTQVCHSDAMRDLGDTRRDAFLLSHASWRVGGGDPCWAKLNRGFGNVYKYPTPSIGRSGSIHI